MRCVISGISLQHAAAAAAGGGGGRKKVWQCWPWHHQQLWNQFFGSSNCRQKNLAGENSPDGKMRCVFDSAVLISSTGDTCGSIKSTSASFDTDTIFPTANSHKIFPHNVSSEEHVFRVSFLFFSLWESSLRRSLAPLSRFRECGLGLWRGRKRKLRKKRGKRFSKKKSRFV